tara:strand:+ start:262 stop:900 length:639 start_codon:yes stop_codon:yes gene_type:complete
MDGNNRWSKIKNMNKFHAYSRGANNLINLSHNIFEKTEVKFITAFALSANNLNRSKKIIDTILSILEINIDQAIIKKMNFSISIRGDLKFLSAKLKKKIEILEKKNSFQKKKLIILMNFSGRQDVIDTINKITLAKKKISINNFYSNSILSNLPDPDILIRTGGYQRISDFLLFNISFTELFFTKKLWPNLKFSDVQKIIYKFKKIERKFGL